jgi:hypothetical protein
LELAAAIDRQAVRALEPNLTSQSASVVWFGALKFIVGASPAEDLATRTIDTLTFGLVGPAVSLPLLAGWEMLIGIGLVTGWLLRVTLALPALQMVGALAPLLRFPGETFAGGILTPTLEGQDIIKNVVIIAAVMVIGATVRGGRLEAEPARESSDR